MPVVSLFSVSDILFFPLAIFILYFVTKAVERKDRNILLAGFWIHVAIVIVHALVVDFYYGGGDTTRFYLCLLHVRRAVDDNVVSFMDIIRMSSLDRDSAFAYYFMHDAMGTENYWYMQASVNFMVVKICYVLSMVFQNSYLAISLCFTIYSLIGSWLLCKTLMKFYPGMAREFYLAALFLPTVIFWSSSVLKDPITFGSLGFIVYGCYQLFYRGKIIWPLILVVSSSYITYSLKTYVFLAYAPSVILLILISKTQAIRHEKARRAMYGFSLILSIILGALLYQNLTSGEMAKAYRTDALFDKIDAQRGIYGEEWLDKEGTSHFTVATSSSSPFILFPAGFVATYFRPFLWEIGNPVMALSALESLFFLFLTIYVFRKVGFKKFFKTALTNPVVLFCFVFAVLFGAAVGASTANFGSLVRYKIPSMPFFMIMLIMIMHLNGATYPRFLQKTLNLIKVR